MRICDALIESKSLYTRYTKRERMLKLAIFVNFFFFLRNF